MTSERTLWVPEEPCKYTFRHAERTDLFEGGVVVVRDTGEFPAQALMEVRRNADTMRLVQVDGDLDARDQINADEEIIRDFRRFTHQPWRSIWAEAWKAALAATDDNQYGVNEDGVPMRKCKCGLIVEVPAPCGSLECRVASGDAS